MLCAGRCDRGSSSNATSHPADLGRGAKSRSSSILLITLDTTRADRLGCYGYPDAKTPNLDALASDGIRFTQAFAPAPITFPAHASLLTGQYPPVHGCHVNGAESLGPSLPTLAEAMKSRGCATAGFVSAFVMHRRFGLDRGFDVYDDNPDAATVEGGRRGERRGDRTCDAALKWLGEIGARPFFAWVHFYDAHFPYAAPPPFGGQGDAYDGELAFVDAQVGRLMKWLEVSGRGKNTLVVVAGDHGESLGDHGEPEHGLFLYDATLRIPLILWQPGGIPEGRVVEQNVDLVDVFPTIMELAGASGTVEPSAGRSLTGLLRDGSGFEARPLYAESEYTLRAYGWAPLRSIVSGQWKYVDAPQRELYDRAADPGETKNLIHEKLDVADELRERLVQMTSAFEARETAAAVPSADASDLLSSLGYVAAPTGDEDSSLPRRDPKEMIATYNRYIEAQKLLDGQKLRDALPLLEAIVKESPESDEFHLNLGKIYMQLGRLLDAEKAFALSLRRNANDPFKLWLLGESLRRQNKLDAAAKCLVKAVEILPSLSEGHRSLGMISLERNQPEAALAAYRRAVEADPKSAAALADLTNVCLQQRRFEEALPLLEKSIALNPRNLDAHRVVPQVLRVLHRRDEAIAAARRGLVLFAQDVALKQSLAWLLATTEGVDATGLEEAMRLSDDLMRDAAGDARSFDTAAASRAATGRFDEAVALGAKAMELASGDAALAAQIETRLNLYRSRRAFRER